MSLRRPKGELSGIEAFLGNRSVSSGAEVEVAAVRKALGQNPSMVILIPKPEIEFGHMLHVADEAHAVGAELAFGGGFARRPEPTDKTIVMSMPGELGWEPERHEFFGPKF